MIPLRACRGGAAEKRMGEPSEATPVGARNSSSSLRVTGRNREGRRCEDLSASGFLTASHGQVSWTSQVPDWPCRPNFTSSFYR